MVENNNGQNQQQPRRQTKAEIVAQREQVRMLGIALGNWREAARQCGLSEGRVLNWVVRYGWKLPKRIQAPHPREVLSTRCRCCHSRSVARGTSETRRRSHARGTIHRDSKKLALALQNATATK